VDSKKQDGLLSRRFNNLPRVATMQQPTVLFMGSSKWWSDGTSGQYDKQAGNDSSSGLDAMATSIEWSLQLIYRKH
jgi:hypothetical protein